MSHSWRYTNLKKKNKTYRASFSEGLGIVSQFDAEALNKKEVLKVISSQGFNPKGWAIEKIA